ncbi:MAG: glycosyltransferase [Actinobacteria bacterium]|nr:glycosyltransferase [Actinomycetota bacterium]
MLPSATIIVPTRGRPRYLAVALASIGPQAAAARAEVLVVEDGPAGPSAGVAAGHGAGYRSLGAHRGLNAARNAGLRASAGDLVVYVDDDVEAGPGWLGAILAAAEAHPEVDVFAGPIRARLEGAAPRGCGREGPPITSLDLGPADGWAPHAWGANMAIRRTAFAAAGEFDEGLSGGGDEAEWQHRHGGPIRYVAAARVDHRRAGADARLPALARAAFRRGVEVRRSDTHAPSPAAELRVLGGCVWHAARRRCAYGLVSAAHSSGRVYAWARAWRPVGVGGDAGGSGAPGDPAAPAGAAEGGRADDFLSGESGTVGGRRDLVRRAADAVLDLELAVRLRACRGGGRPRRRVLVLTVVRPEHAGLRARAAAELRRSPHEVTLAACPPGGRGKFENLGTLLVAHPPDGYDWLLVLDDDVELPRGFLEHFLGLAERFDLRLAQPAHRHCSHAAWRLTRRRPGSLVRETRFVEIGPVTALHRETFAALLPFPNLRMGWGLDAHWAAVAARHGWRLGVVDATPIGHRARPAGDAYSRAQAIDEARAFLAARPYLPAAESQRTLAVHRRCA